MCSKSKPLDAARRWTLRAYSAPGRFSGTSPKMPGSRPGSSRLIASQLRSTSAAPSTAISPKTCGWRRISFWRQCSATRGRRARRRRRLGRVLAVLGAVALAAVGLGLPALAEGLDERVECLLLVLGGQRLLDRRLGLVERLLRRLGDLVDLEDVIAE